MSGDRLRIHATCVSLEGRGILLRGASGSGKSDLALRLIAEAGARLVADDHCILEMQAGRLVARAPEAIAGFIEARGVGILNLPYVPQAEVHLVVDLASEAQAERLPDPDHDALLGVRVPKASLDPLTASAVAKLRLAVQRAAPAIMPSVPSGHDAREEANESGRHGIGKAAGRVRMTDRHRRRRMEPRKEAARPPADRRLRVVVVTGISGAGRSTTLKALEDVGYEAIDNLPLHLIPSLVREGEITGPIAIGVDIRTRNFAVEPFVEALAELEADPALRVTLVFVDCEDEVLQRRYTETRRRHPLAHGRPVSDGIVAERRLVAPLRRRADVTIDTSTLSVNDLRQVVAAQLGLQDGPRMTIFVTSFSYRNGLPREADLVFDVRFLKNPHYEDRLRPLTGRDATVAEYVAADKDFEPFFATLTTMVERLVPRYEAEGKSYLTVALGCTGGRHRSVSVTERLAAFLRDQGRQVIVNHRDLAPGDDNK